MGLKLNAFAVSSQQQQQQQFHSELCCKRLFITIIIIVVVLVDCGGCHFIVIIMNAVLLWLFVSPSPFLLLLAWLRDDVETVVNRFYAGSETHTLQRQRATESTAS